LEVWEKVLLDAPEFFETVHGRYGCITCHGGEGGTDDKAAAHEGVIRDPDSAQTCGACHPEQVAAESQSLHYNLAGYTAALAARSVPDRMAQLDVMMDHHCNTCHTTCGQCHVSRPTNLEGGLVEGHLFKGTPSMNLTCVGCHGSRIENEYKGKNAGIPADVHWIKGGMPCFDCHSGSEMHGALGEPEHRYDGPPIPSCRDAGCHPEVASGDGIQQHTEFHFQALSCQACHSTTYKNCYSCHVGQEDGVPYFKTDESQMLFKIGRNPLQSEDRPWTYVPVRHVPIDPDSFAYYGENLLPNFDALPTWKYATPHNIQRITPQNETCGSCHGNPEFFLTADDVDPEELDANQNVIVKDLPFSMP
jgi:thiosulfate/3-mercaptopyruvate sulfurtransferase